MALGLGGPLAAFGIGKEIGQANSPVNGLGQAIRGILETSRKGGLLRAQSEAQSAGANQNAILAEDRKAISDDQEVNQLVVGPGGTTSNVPIKRGDPRPVTEPSTPQNIFQQLSDFKSQMDKNKNVTTDTGAGGIAEEAIAELQAAGLPINEENMAEAIRQLSGGQ